MLTKYVKIFLVNIIAILIDITHVNKNFLVYKRVLRPLKTDFIAKYLIVYLYKCQLKHKRRKVIFFISYEHIIHARSRNKEEKEEVSLKSFFFFLIMEQWRWLTFGFCPSVNIK